MTTPKPPREWILNVRDGIINPGPTENIGQIVHFKGFAPKQSDIVHVIEKSYYDEILAKYNFMVDSAQQNARERDELEIMIERINTHVFPGEIDSIDSLRTLIKERDEARAEIERLKISRYEEGRASAAMDREEAIFSERKVCALLAECEKALGRIVGQVEKWTDEHGITRITECDSSIIAREALTKLKASKGGI